MIKEKVQFSLDQQLDGDIYLIRRGNKGEMAKWEKINNEWLTKLCMQLQPVFQVQIRSFNCPSDNLQVG